MRPLPKVDLKGIEPLTSSVRLRRAPNCATGPRESKKCKPQTDLHPLRSEREKGFEPSTYSLARNRSTN